MDFHNVIVDQILLYRLCLLFKSKAKASLYEKLIVKGAIMEDSSKLETEITVKVLIDRV
jgi:hypothetical protein